MAKPKPAEPFSWTDDEVELLLRVTHEHKVAKTEENCDWESLQNKYSDIFDRYQELYPSPEQAQETGQQFPHRAEEFSKGQLIAKLKAIRFRYRQSVDSGRKKGHGRVVLLYFDLCESIWGGYNATRAMSAEEAVDGSNEDVVPKTDEGEEPVTGSSGYGNQPGQQTAAVKNKARDAFCWSDDEVELLLKVANEYKEVKTAENVDWETSPSKYVDIFERYQECYMCTEEALAIGKDFPHKKEDFTKVQLTTKLKGIRVRYRQALETGKKTGHGRPVLLYYDLCESIWGGSPVVPVASDGGEESAWQEMEKTYAVTDSWEATAGLPGSATPDKQQAAAAKSKTKDALAWTDDEVELLLKVAHEYKEQKAAENVDWETSLSKYSDILERYLECYMSPEEAQDIGKDFPHKKEEITKGHLSAKLKTIRFRYKQALNSGRRRGHGRMVLLFFDLCQLVWGVETGCIAEEGGEAIARSPTANEYEDPETGSLKGKAKDVFSWSDDELELLLKVAHEYKLVKAAENLDWDTTPSKFIDILERYQERYPSPDEAQVTGKNFPHNKEDITRGQLSNKLKTIRAKYKQAVESGKRKGHGRVITLYFDLCESLWGGPPPTHAVPVGKGSGAVRPVTSSHATGSSSVADRGANPIDAAAGASIGALRRENLKRKLPTDVLEQQDVDIKRRLLQRLEVTIDKFVQTMSQWSSTMERLNSNIEQLMQHVVGTGGSPMSAGSPRNVPQSSESCEQTPTKAPLQDYIPPANGKHSSDPPALNGDSQPDAEL